MHFPDCGIDGGFARIYGSRHQVVTVRIFAGSFYARAKFVTQHYFVALCVVTEDGDGVATFHDLAGDQLPPALMFFDVKDVAIQAQKPFMQWHSLADPGIQDSAGHARPRQWRFASRLEVAEFAVCRNRPPATIQATVCGGQHAPVTGSNTESVGRDQHRQRAAPACMVPKSDGQSPKGRRCRERGQAKPLEFMDLRAEPDAAIGQLGLLRWCGRWMSASAEASGDRTRSTSTRRLKMLDAVSEAAERGWQILMERTHDQKLRNPESRINVNVVLNDRPRAVGGLREQPSALFRFEIATDPMEVDAAWSIVIRPKNIANRRQQPRIAHLMLDVLPTPVRGAIESATSL